jgi:hypothetical protein
MSQFSPDARQSLAKRLREYDRYLERRYADDRIHVYEIVGFPR